MGWHFYAAVKYQTILGICRICAEEKQTQHTMLLTISSRGVVSWGVVRLNSTHCCLPIITLQHFGAHVTFQPYISHFSAPRTSLFDPLYVTFWLWGHAHIYTAIPLLDKLHCVRNPLSKTYIPYMDGDISNLVFQISLGGQQNPNYCLDQVPFFG